MRVRVVAGKGSGSGSGRGRGSFHLPGVNVWRDLASDLPGLLDLLGLLARGGDCRSYAACTRRPLVDSPLECSDAVGGVYVPPDTQYSLQPVHSHHRCSHFMFRDICVWEYGSACSRSLHTCSKKTQSLTKRRDTRRILVGDQQWAQMMMCSHYICQWEHLRPPLSSGTSV